jgi:hypothetical protein
MSPRHSCRNIDRNPVIAVEGKFQRALNIQYWLDGLAGTGKSVIARTIVERAAGKGMLDASFLFSRGDPPLRQPTLLFLTLAFQRARSDDAFKNVIWNALKQDTSIGYKGLQPQLQVLILSPLLKIDQNRRTTLIVLDSVDEYEGSEAGEICKTFGVPCFSILYHARSFTPQSVWSALLPC